MLSSMRVYERGQGAWCGRFELLTSMVIGVQEERGSNSLPASCLGEVRMGLLIRISRVHFYTDDSQ